MFAIATFNILVCTYMRKHTLKGYVCFVYACVYYTPKQDMCNMFGDVSLCKLYMMVPTIRKYSSPLSLLQRCCYCCFYMKDIPKTLCNIVHMLLGNIYVTI